MSSSGLKRFWEISIIHLTYLLRGKRYCAPKRLCSNTRVEILYISLVEKKLAGFINAKDSCV